MMHFDVLPAIRVHAPLLPVTASVRDAWWSFNGTGLPATMRRFYKEKVEALGKCAALHNLNAVFMLAVRGLGSRPAKVGSQGDACGNSSKRRITEALLCCCRE